MLIHANALHEIYTRPSNSVDLICTDPPYGDGDAFQYGRSHLSIVGNTSPILGLLVLQESLRLLRDNRFALVFLGQSHLPFIDSYLGKYLPAKLRGYIVWDKQHFGLGYGIRHQHELVAVIEKGTPPYEIRSIPSTLSFPREPTPLHPHQKPLSLVRYLIQSFSRPGDIVFDPFMGSGTTGVACAELSREFIGIELDQNFFSIAKTRIEDAQCATSRSLPSLSLVSAPPHSIGISATNLAAPSMKR